MEAKLKTLKLQDEESDSDDETIEISNETNVDVGLIDIDCDDLSPNDLKLCRIKLRSPFFPSKVGGKPAWLDYTNVPMAIGSSVISTSEVIKTSSSCPTINLVCDTCKSQLVFLLQVYAPISDTDKFANRLEAPEDAFHRTLFVFVCTNAQCNTKGVKVIRSQMNRKNELYLYEPPPQENDDQDG